MCGGDFEISQWNSLPELPNPDVQILSSGGLIAVHSSVLASASPVLKNMIETSRKPRSSEIIIPIFGVPGDAVEVFIQFLYSSRCAEEELKKFGFHLLVLSHVYMIPRLKHMSTAGLGQLLTIENVVDLLQLSRLCDAPELYVRCINLVSNQYLSVLKTEGWKFLQDNDPWLELDILQFIAESEKRRKRTRRHREEQRLYEELSDGLECLKHICTNGCTSVGPRDREPDIKTAPCSKFSTCRGVQALIKHFATCKKRGNGGCSRCKRMWQLLRLHSSICDQPDSCRVPLCRHFKLKMEHKASRNDTLWRLLVRKVAFARAMSSLFLTEKEERPIINEGNNL